jgi:hypothetical protein
MRFLAILQVSPNADLDRVLYNSQLGENGDLDITVGEWNIAASLNPNLSPELIIRKTDGNSTLTIYPKDVEINGRKLKGKQANSSLLAEKKNGKTTIQEVVDAMPHAMKNVILYHR